jgi:cytochrome c2
MKWFLWLVFFFILHSRCVNKQGNPSVPLVKNNLPYLKDSSTINKGKELFITNCTACHKKNEDYTGPALAGISQRWNSKEELFAYIKNAPEVIKTNAYARALYKKWNESVMMPFEQLSDKELEALLAYIEN